MFNAYVIAFGGLLLLGGRLSDLLGAKRVFSLGWVVLAAGSLAAGLADSTDLEIAARAVQGAGAALIAPSALTLLMMLFGSDPKELMKAFAIYGAAAPAGGTAGVFLGGVITEWISWPWVFYINIPIALAVLALVPGLMPAAPARRGSIDLAGAATATAGLALTVFGIVRAPEEGWGSAATLGAIAGGVALLALFVAIQAARREPLMRLSIFRAPNLAAANVAQLMLGAAWIPTWFFLNLYLQQRSGCRGLIARRHIRRGNAADGGARAEARRGIGDPRDLLVGRRPEQAQEHDADQNDRCEPSRDGQPGRRAPPRWHREDGGSRSPRLCRDGGAVGDSGSSCRRCRGGGRGGRCSGRRAPRARSEVVDRHSRGSRRGCGCRAGGRRSVRQRRRLGPRRRVGPRPRGGGAGRDDAHLARGDCRWQRRGWSRVGLRRWDRRLGPWRRPRLRRWPRRHGRWIRHSRLGRWIRYSRLGRFAGVRAAAVVRAGVGHLNNALGSASRAAVSAFGGLAAPAATSRASARVAFAPGAAPGAGGRPLTGSPRHVHGRRSTSTSRRGRRSRTTSAPAASATTSCTRSAVMELPSSPRAMTNAASRANSHSALRCAWPIEIAARRARE